MKISSTLLFALAMSIATLLSGCARPQEHIEVTPMDMSAVRTDMRAIANARILLGHKSVGRNILAGLEALSVETGVPLRIETIDGAPPDTGPGVFHSEIGDSGDPDGKCEIFAQLLDRPERPAYDLAMMKFCYSDLKPETPLDATAMVDRYSRLVNNIKERRPDVRMVHVTIPVRAEPPGRKTMLKRFLAMSVEGDAGNILRSHFNEELRTRFAAEPMFDLAMLEATRPDGSVSAFSNGGRTIHTLAAEYTDDGGHLNALGRRRAAIEFVRVLALALPQDS